MATLGSVVVYQRQAMARLKGADGSTLALPAPAPGPAVERTFETLGVGDVVTWGTDDWLIRQTAMYDEEGERWWLHLLDDGVTLRFLEVRRLDGTEVVLFSRAEDAPLFGQLSQGLTFRGQPYLLDIRGDAFVSVDAVGAEKEFESGRLRYSRYQGPGGAVLVIEEQGDTRRAFAGEKVAKATVSLMPGDRASVRPTTKLGEELDQMADRIV